MVLRKFIRIVLGTAVFILMSVLFSCEEIFFVDCTECELTEPSEAYLQIQLDQNSEGARVTIYEGNPEDSVKFMKFTSYTEVLFQKVPLNKSYTLTAEYPKNGKVYVVVNSVIPRVKYEEEKCNDPCYYIHDDIVDLHLKYAK
jgi:hypothetical protein